MEEDIKILEEYKDNYLNIHETDKEGIELGHAIENLIKGYRQLEEENARLGMLNLVQEDMIKELENNSIPKSRIKEKIEKIKSSPYWADCGDSYENDIKLLQELMEDK